MPVINYFLYVPYGKPGLDGFACHIGIWHPAGTVLMRFHAGTMMGETSGLDGFAHVS